MSPGRRALPITATRARLPEERLRAFYSTKGTGAINYSATLKLNFYFETSSAEEKPPEMQLQGDKV